MKFLLFAWQFTVQGWSLDFKIFIVSSSSFLNSAGYNTLCPYQDPLCFGLLG